MVASSLGMVHMILFEIGDYYFGSLLFYDMDTFYCRATVVRAPVPTQACARSH